MSQRTRAEAAEARVAELERVLDELARYAHVVADNDGTLGTLRRLAKEAKQTLARSEAALEGK